jgi:hypothetical protein
MLGSTRSAILFCSAGPSDDRALHFDMQEGSGRVCAHRARCSLASKAVVQVNLYESPSHQSERTPAIPLGLHNVTMYSGMHRIPISPLSTS